MKERNEMGMNRTGMQISPLGSPAMQAQPARAAVSTQGSDAALGAMRSAYIADAEPVGSTASPGSIADTGTSVLPGGRAQLLLDKLGERLAFERTGTRLYDALLTKVETLQEGTTSMTMAELRRIRDEEARHFSVVASAIESLGGDPTCQTPCADVAGMEAWGLTQVVTDPRTSLAHSLHAVLVAEMTDNHGWEMLIAIAEEQDQMSLISDFTVALNEERAHLQLVQKWFEEATFGVAISNEAVDEAESPLAPPLH